MVVNTVFEIKNYGDFGTPVTRYIMVSEHRYDTKVLLEEFYKLYNIDSNEGLSQEMLGTIYEKFEKFLRSKDFRKLKTIPVIFSD